MFASDNDLISRQPCAVTRGRRRRQGETFAAGYFQGREHGNREQTHRIKQR